MEKTNKLMHDISDANDNTTRIENYVEEFDKELNEIHDNLEESKKVNRSLKDLDASLKTASELLLVVGIIPAISTAASTLRRTIDTFHKPIKEAVKTSDSVEKVIEPIRKSIKTIETKLDTVDQTLLNVMNRENQCAQILGIMVDSIGALPVSTIKTNLDKKADNFSATADPTVLTLDKLQIKLLKGLDSTKDKIYQLNAWAKGLVQLNIEIQSVFKALGPLISSLKAIAGVFKQTISVPYGGYPKMCYRRVWGVKIPYPCGWKTVYFSFTIQQILNGVTDIVKPVMDLLNAAMSKILNPLLKALNLNIKLPEIQGLRILNEIKSKFSTTFNTVSITLNGLIDELDSFKTFLADLQKFIDAITAIDMACRSKEGVKRTAKKTIK